jgi:hypothetical protein
MSSTGLQSAVQALREQYASSTKCERTLILDHLCAVFHIHRKHAIRLLNRSAPAKMRPPGRPRVYDHEAMLPALVSIWKTSNLICGKRLASILSLWIPHYRDGKRRPLPDAVQSQLCQLSPVMIDRLLVPYRRGTLKLGFATTRPGTLLRKQIPISTEQWNEKRPGFLEADTVAHCGTSMQGMFVYTVAVVDLASGWVEHRAVWGRGETGVRKALVEIESVLPFRIRGFDCDNGGEFLNHHLVKHFLQRKRPVAFTRSRPYQKNDNAHIEEKNWTKVRQYLGYARFEHPDLVEMLNELYRKEWTLFHNFFLPAFKLIDKQRRGGRIHKVHDKPKTPCQRLLEHPDIARARKRELNARCNSLNPFELQHVIAKKIRAIQTLAATVRRDDP